MSLLRPVDMRAQTFLLLAQGLLLLPPDALAAHDHHDRLVARLFAVRRAARRVLVPLALQRAKFFSSLAPSRYRRHALLVVRLGLLARAEDVVLRDERRRRIVRADRGGGRLFGGFERGELALCGRAAPGFDGFGGGLYSQVVDQCEISWCEDLGAKNVCIN